MPSVPDPEHVKPWYLRNITEALALDDASGNVYVRTGFTGNIVIEGNVNIPGEVTVVSNEADPLYTHTHIYTPNDDEVSDTNPFAVNVFNFPETQTIAGNVSILTMPNVNASVTGNVIVSSGNVNANVQGNVGILGNITFTNTTIEVTQGTDPWNISGNVDVLSLPAITGNVNANVSGNVVVTSGNINANVTQGTDPWIVTGNVNANVSGNVVVTSGNINSNVTGNVVVTSGNVNANVSGNVGVLTLPSITGNVVVTSGNINANVSGNVVITSGNINSNVTGNVVVTSGNINSNVSGNVGIIGNVNVTQGTNPWVVSGNVGITSNANVALGGTQLDAFGRLRVSNPFTLFDGALRYRDDEFKWNQVDTGAGVSTFLPNESTMLMTVSGNGDSAVRQSKQVFSYQPGKSLLTMMTFVMNTPTAGLRQRAGYFGAQNGVYFEVDGTTVNLVIRKYTSGSVDDTTEKIPQSLWNGDKLNGTGASGITLDVTHSQIFWCDIEWLGVGSVRSGFVINGQFIVCHIFHHANIFDRVYMTTASLPVRYELTSTGTAGTMRAICSTVISEGGYSNRSQSRAIGTSLTGKNLTTTVYRPLVCIRLKSANIDSIVVPTKFDLYGLQLAAFGYRVILNPTLTDAVWTSAGDNSSVEYDLSATALTGGTVIDQGIFVGSNKGGAASVSGNDVDFSNQLGRTIAGVSDIWCLAAIATTNNDDAVASVSWQEHG